MVQKYVHLQYIISFSQICYGTTENSPVTYQSYMDDPLDKRVSTVGRPADHAEVNMFPLKLE